LRELAQFQEWKRSTNGTFSLASCHAKGNDDTMLIALAQQSVILEQGNDGRRTAGDVDVLNHIADVLSNFLAFTFCVC
jgi:hypothetical protein